jgi:hypothetical protein
MTFHAKRLLSRTALTTTLTATLLAGMVAAPRAAHADEQTVKLIQLLIQKGILSPGQAKDLLKETASPKGHAKVAPALPVEAEAAPAAAATPGQIRVTYVPQFIRKQIADEVRAQVLDEAKDEHWAAPNALPEWTQRFKLYGDFRMRYEADLFDKNNYNQFLNFNNINSGNGFDANSYVLGTQANPGFLNTTTDRNQFRLQARLGTKIYIDDWITGDFRIATGSTDGPVSENQTLGQNGGDFSKYSIWLDRAALYLTPLPGLQIGVGRTNNPFLPSDLMFYPSLSFDGVSVKYNRNITDTINLFGTGGAFPLFNTAFDFSTNSDQKYTSTDAYLVGLQAGAAWQARPDVKATLGVGIFDFLNVQGAVSAPCSVQPATQFYCSTDDTRAPFVQFGNTLFALRDIVPTGAANPPNPQYYGLASRFNVLDIHPRIDITTYHPFDIALEGQLINNLAYDRSAIVDRATPNTQVGPVNNIGSCPKNDTSCVPPYQGGGTGYMFKVTAGHLEIHNRWDWNTSLAYRYLQTDATLDAIDDSEFHNGGTNAKGYILWSKLGIAKDTWLGLKYLNATAVSGPQYNIQSVYLDINSSF